MRIRKDYITLNLRIYLLFLLALSGCGGEQLYSQSRILMDTVVSIKVAHSDSRIAHKAIEAGFKEIERIDRLMDFYDPGSELSKINRSGGKEIKVNSEIMEVISTSLKYSKLTNGAFDITIAPVIRLWNFKEGRRIPEEARLKEALKLVGYKKIKLDPKKGTVKLSQPEMMIDLGGVAKGYAVSRATQVLKDIGISSALIDAGGDIEVIGKRSGRPWRIGVQHPRAKNKILKVLNLDQGAVATSGDYERFFILNGRRYHHILDPKTGYPTHGCISVTIIAPSAFIADILSTAVFVLGPDKGMELIEEMEGIEGIIVTEKRMIFSSGMGKYL